MTVTQGERLPETVAKEAGAMKERVIPAPRGRPEDGAFPASRVTLGNDGELGYQHEPEIDDYVGLCRTCGGALGDHARPRTRSERHPQSSLAPAPR